MAPGHDGDFTILDTARRWTIDEGWLPSRAGWSPFTGMTPAGRPIGPIVRGGA